MGKITLKDYVKMFADAKEKGDVSQMEEAFDGLISELDIEDQDPQSDAAQRKTGELLAKLRNTPQPVRGKKI